VIGPSALQQVAPNTVTYVEGTDFGVITQSDPGDVTANVTAVDLQLGLGNTSNSGCDAADWVGFPAGNIALLQRGFCTFEIKAENAAAAGAVGIVIFNQGDTADPARQGIPAVTLTANNTSGIPVLGTTYALGAQLAGISGLRMRVFANTLREIKTTFNVLAETNTGDDSNVVIAGAHVDSVLAGPGINDNGSGSAALVEVALQMAHVQPQNTVRFAWWGAHDADRSTWLPPTGVTIPAGSAAIEDIFESYYTKVGEPYDDTQFSGRASTRRSSSTTSPPGGCSRAPKSGRPPPSRRSGAARPGPSSTPATTRRATRSTTSRRTRSRSTATRSRSPC
jgi:Peptidase family M28/PA domain